MLQVFLVNVYFFPYVGTTHSLVTPLISRKFDVLPNVLIEPFLVVHKWVILGLQRDSIGNVM